MKIILIADEGKTIVKKSSGVIFGKEVVLDETTYSGDEKESSDDYEEIDDPN